MKGLVHRLASRALGQALPVRADTRPPLGTAGPGWADSGAQPHTFGGPAASNASANIREQPGQGAVGAPPQLSTSTPFGRPRTDAAPAPEWQVEPVSAGLPPAASVPVPGAGEPFLVRPFAAGAEAAVRQVAAMQRSVDASSGAVGVPEMRRTTRSDVPLAATLPPALRPAMPPPATAAVEAPPQVSGAPVRPGAVDDSRTEVHIHIGRIDVTALPDTAPRRTPAPAAVAPMSLDAYLARRSRS